MGSTGGTEEVLVLPNSTNSQYDVIIYAPVTSAYLRDKNIPQNMLKSLRPQRNLTYLKTAYNRRLTAYLTVEIVNINAPTIRIEI